MVASLAMAGEAPRFCPFCREAYEGERVCPEHELELVAFDELPARQRVVADDEAVPPWEMRYGRGPLALAALGLLLSPLAPLVTATVDGQRATASGYEVAVGVGVTGGGAPYLWMVPGVAAALVLVLMRRRTPAKMRGARIAVPLLVLLAGASVGLTLWRVQLGAARMADMSGREVGVEVGWGVYGTALFVVIGFVGGLRLGVAPKQTREAPPE